MIVPPHLAAALNNSGGGSGGNNNNSGNNSSSSSLSVTGAGGSGAVTAAPGATSSSLLVSGSQDSLSGFVLSGVGGGGGGGGGGNGNGSGSSGSGSSRTGSSNGSGHRILAVNRNIDDLLFGSDLDSLINDNIINGFKSLKLESGFIRRVHYTSKLSIIKNNNNNNDDVELVQLSGLKGFLQSATMFPVIRIEFLLP
ncbi:hypothetical protein RP20_CCG028435 [Aedes albopictus]|nr:hypothetical protein RP20_CCG028435 [Aedes albopictus]